MKKFIKRLESEISKTPYLVHAKNILTQWQNLHEDGKKDSNKFEGLKKIVGEYKLYFENNQIKGADEATIRKRVDSLNKYYNFLHTNGFDNLFSAQTKFRPTILEEFMAILFRDLVETVQQKCPKGKLDLGSVKAYANLFFYGKDFNSFIAAPSIGLNQKDQDFAIYRNIELSMDGSSPILASLPVVAVECKTFIDKTMLEGSVATAEKIKTGNPYSLFCMVSELYDVSMNVDPAYSRIDQIYILRKGTRRGPWKDIDAEVVLSFVNKVEQHLTRPWSDIAKKLSETGTLI